MIDLQNKKILYVIGSLDRGGCEGHLLAVLPELKKNDTDIQIFLLSHAGVLASDFENAGIKLIYPWIQSSRNIQRSKIFRILRLMLVTFQFVITLITLRPNLVHFFLPASYWIGGIVSSFYPFARKVMSRRSLNNYMCNNRLVQRIESFLHPRMDFVLGNSKAVTQQLLEEGAPAQKTGLIYNGINESKTGELSSISVREALDISSEAIVMTIVANLIPYKGHIDLIEALGHLEDKDMPDWHLLVVGRDDGIGPELQAAAKELGLEKRIHFLGARSDVSKIYEESDVGLLVSHEEGFSNAILEGMMNELPMIVTDVGGNAEAVIDSENGMVVPASNPKKLSQAIRVLLVDNTLRMKMGHASRARWESNFTLSKCVANYQYLYSCLLGKKPASKLISNS